MSFLDLQSKNLWVVTIVVGDAVLNWRDLDGVAGQTSLFA